MKPVTLTSICLLAVACSSGPEPVTSMPASQPAAAVAFVEAVPMDDTMGSPAPQATADTPTPVDQSSASTTAYMLRKLVQRSTGDNNTRMLAIYRCCGAFAELKAQGYTVPEDVDGFFTQVNAANSSAFAQLGQVGINSSIGGGTMHKEVNDLADSPQKMNALLSYARLLKADQVTEAQLNKFRTMDANLKIQKDH